MRWPGILLACVVAGCTVEPSELSLATLTEEPAPTIAETVRASLDARGFEINVVSADDAVALADSVLSGEADLAILEEPDRPIPGLATIAPLYPSVLHILVRRNNTETRFNDLIAGNDIWAGPPGGSASRLLGRLAADAGLEPGDYTLLDNPWTTEPDVHFILGGLLDPDNARQLSGYRLFSFRRDGDVPGGTPADAIALRHHDVRPFLLPAGIYPALADDAVLTLAVRSILVAREDIDDEVIYDVAAALFGSVQDIARDYPLVTHELDEGLRHAELMLPLHDGARRYIDRDGPGFVERYVEVLALTFTTDPAFNDTPGVFFDDLRVDNASP